MVLHCKHIVRELDFLRASPQIINGRPLKVKSSMGTEDEDYYNFYLLECAIFKIEFVNRHFLRKESQTFFF